MTDLRFGVLGPLSVSRGADVVPVPPGRRRAVLACLLVHAGRPVASDVLIEAAWRDDLPEEPRAALHTVLSRLRRTLGGDLIVSTAAGYALVASGEVIDAHRFESLRSRASSAPPAQAAALLHEALALWRGSAYEEFIEHDFAVPESQRLERLRLDATEERAAAVLDAGRHDEAVTELEILLDEHPFREHALELLMTALYKAGRQTEALARYRAHRDLLAEELGLDPSPVLRDLEFRILGHTVSPRREWSPLGVPAWLDTSTGFFGRDATVAGLVDAVASNRLVTVTGVGGVGKTRLVAEALPAVSERLRVSIAIVELAQVQPGRVSAAVADALGLSLRSSEVTEDVLEYLSIADALVVLDSCEHLRAEVARLADLVARRCPAVRLLTTSRHRLGTSSERVVPLAPFPMTGPAEELTEHDANPAVRLFTDRARRLRPSFSLTPENVGLVVDVCRRLDGLPLALELAASRAARLGVAPLLRSLEADRSGEPLEGLHGVLDGSVRLLTAEQRRLFCHLAVFAGAFSADDVVRMGARLGPWEEQGGLVAALEELVEANLLASHLQGVEVHYRMLAMVRSLAGRLLAESGEEAMVRLAHAHWVDEVVERGAHDWISGSAAIADAQLTRVGPDVNAALRWALGAGRIDVAAHTTGAVKLCLHWLPGVELGDLVLEVAQRCVTSDPDPALAIGMAAGAMTSAERGDTAGTRSFTRATLDASEAAVPRMLACMALAVSTFYSGEHEESLRWLRRVAELPELPAGYRVEPHITRALLACYRDDLETARASMAIALTGAAAARAEAAHAFAVFAAGEIEARDDPDRGAARFREAVAEAERIGAAHVSEVARLALFAVLVRQERHAEALDLVVPLLRDLHRAGAWPQLWTTLRIAAELVTAHERWGDAVFLFAAAEAAPTAPPLVGDDVGRYADLSDELSRHLGPSVVARVTELAAGIPRSQVVDRAMTLLADVGPHAALRTWSACGVPPG